MAFADKTEVVNAALSTFGEPDIRDFDTDTVIAAIEARRWFDLTVERELSKFDWPFSIERTVVAKDATDPPYGWTSRYPVPLDSVRFLPLTDDGEDTGAPIPHEVESGFILADRTADIKLRYIRLKTDPASWSHWFSEVMVAALALRFAENLTGLSQALSTAQQRYQITSEEARRFEGRQAGTTPEPYVDSWMGQRY